jgi:hypothetical protein
MVKDTPIDDPRTSPQRASQTFDAKFHDLLQVGLDFRRKAVTMVMAHPSDDTWQ